MFMIFIVDTNDIPFPNSLPAPKIIPAPVVTGNKPCLSTHIADNSFGMRKCCPCPAIGKL